MNRFIIATAIAGMTLSAVGCIKPATPSVTSAAMGNGASAETAKGTEVSTNSNPGKGSDKPGIGDASGNVRATADTVNVEGSSTVYLIAQAWAVEYEKLGNCKVSLARNGTGGGYKSFALRRCDLWNASRPIAEKEKAELKEKGIDWLELEIAIDGLSVAVNPKNDWCTELTVADLRKLWKPDSTVMKWNDLNPKWPEQKIELFGADVDSGTFEYFTEVIVGKKNSSRTSYRAAADDNVLIQGVSRSKFGLGYIPFGYCVENKEKIKLIKISPTVEATDTPAPAVLPTVETILSGEYRPLSRPLFVYVNKAALKRPEIVGYLKFALSKEAQPLVSERGFVQIPEERRLAMVARLEGALQPEANPIKEMVEDPAVGEAKPAEAETPK